VKYPEAWTLSPAITQLRTLSRLLRRHADPPLPASLEVEDDNAGSVARFLNSMSVLARGAVPPNMKHAAFSRLIIMHSRNRREMIFLMTERLHGRSAPEALLCTAALD
jgi:hypothetical protein